MQSRLERLQMLKRLRLLLHFSALGNRVFDCADHVERLLGQVVVLAIQDLQEAFDGICTANVNARQSGKDLTYEEWLRQEALDLARPATLSTGLRLRVLRYPRWR